MQRTICTLSILGLLILSGCVSSVRHSVVDVRAPLEQSESDRVYRALALTLLDQGFELKHNDAALRLITTEPKKYESVSGWPPFDFYLSMTALVRNVPGGSGAELTLRPKIREQNRINANAFTEHPLYVYSPEEAATPMGSISRAEAMQKGHRLFQAILAALAHALGVSENSFIFSMQDITVDGL